MGGLRDVRQSVFLVKRKGFADRLPAPLEAIRCHEGDTEVPLVEPHERGKCLFALNDHGTAPDLVPSSSSTGDRSSTVTRISAEWGLAVAQDRAAQMPIPNEGGSPMQRLRCDSGATAVEYSLLLAFIFATAFLSVQVFGGSVANLFDAAVDIWP